MQIVNDDRPVSELSNEEIQAYLVRLARSGQYPTAQLFMAEARKCFEGISDERLKHCIGLTAIALKKQHDFMSGH